MRICVTRKFSSYVGSSNDLGTTGNSRRPHSSKETFMLDRHRARAKWPARLEGQNRYTRQLDRTPQALL